MKRKILSTLLAMFMIFSVAVVPAFAAEDATESSMNRISTSVFADSDAIDIDDEFIAEYALNFMKASQDENVSISHIEKMYDLNDNITGYYVLFENNNCPKGYVLISLLTEGSPVVDFSLEGAGIFDIEKSTSQNFLQNSYNASKLIYTGPDCIYLDNGYDYVYSIYDETPISKDAITNQSADFLQSRKEDATAATNDSIYDGFIDWDYASLNTSSVFKINNFGSGSDYWKMTAFSNGNVCAPTAGTNILWYWGFKRGASSVQDPVSNISGNQNKAREIFDILDSGMWTSDSLGTLDAKVPSGYKKYFGEAAGKGKWNYATISNGSAYSTFTNALNDQCPIHLQLRMNSNPFTTDGHDVFNFGYARSTSGTQYLFVMDGWNSYGRFVKFSYYPVVKGYKIWVNTN